LLQRNGAASDVPEDLLPSPTLNVQNWRQRIRDNVWDSIAWVELSRTQLCNGHFDHAKRSMDVALSISPNNRHVLRSAARLYFQTGDYDKSYEIIRNNAATPTDPWLMAAEVALADYARKSSFFAKKGLLLLDSETQWPSQISELAGALGTEVLKSGGNRRGRNLIRQSLGVPTINAMAQAEWISRQLKEELVQEIQIATLQGAWEAAAVHYFSRGKFEEALRCAQKWIDSEEYNLQAYTSAAGAANILEMFAEAIQFLERAVRIGGITVPIRNAFAFAQASIGNLDVAERILNNIPEAAGVNYYVEKANLGLVAFRRGLVGAAKEKYLEALGGFRRISNQEMEATALVYFSYELQRANELSEAERRLK
jgi:tetratricopeptide (TPR) repeat protein